jgi:benzoyl-CoA 2,3-dioxygenase component B
MLTEEAHHMFVGDTGIARVIKRSLEVMKTLRTDEPERVRAAGAIDLPTVQRYLNFWCSSSLDLFGSESSSNAASAFAAGLKGRPDEAQYDDHVARDGVMMIERPDGRGGVTSEAVPQRNALNEVLRLAYLRDCEIGLRRWNRLIEKTGIGPTLTLPSPRFHRTIGVWAGAPIDPQGRLVAPALLQQQRAAWLPSESDRAFITSLMQGVTTPGQIASWIAPPDRGINNLPVDYAYVRF